MFTNYVSILMNSYSDLLKESVYSVTPVGLFNFTQLIFYGYDFKTRIMKIFSLCNDLCLIN